MLTAGNPNFIAYGGWAFTLIFGLAAVAAYLTGTVRKSVAEARTRDLDDQDKHIKRQDARITALEEAVKECERRDADKATTIANLSSQIESADSVAQMAKAARIAAEDAATAAREATREVKLRLDRLERASDTRRRPLEAHGD